MTSNLNTNLPSGLAKSATDRPIYLDNAATTALDTEVLEAMMPYMTTHYGNPSSIYSYGRQTRMAIENARKSVAQLLRAKTGEIFFTSGGTESSNTAISTAIRDLGCRHIITSPIEHHAVLHTVEFYAKQKSVTSGFVKLSENGEVEYDNLELQLQNISVPTLVTLMHANNEIGTLLNIKKAGELCKKYGAIFHSDCVQTIGHYPVDITTMNVHFISAAGHKFHGPKGTGLLYVNENIKIQPLMIGGGQERNMRAGTENVYGIVGFAKALEIAMRDFEKDSTYIKNLRAYMMASLKAAFPDVHFNNNAQTLYTILSACFPKSAKSEMLLFNLDINNICASGGSACSSGADAGSHVMKALNKSEKWMTIRFSFSKYNKQEEIDHVVEKLKGMI